MNEQAKVHSVKSNAARAARKALGNPQAQAGADFLLVEVEGGWRWKLPNDAAEQQAADDLASDMADGCGVELPAELPTQAADEFDDLLADMQAMPAQPKEPKAAKAKAAKAPKPAKVHPDLALAMQGVIPKLEVKSAANPSYQKKADALRSLACGGDLDGLKAYEIGGVNTYAKMLRRYRDHLVVAVETLNTKVAG